MSEEKRAAALAIFERAVNRMAAFGYVDRGWIKAAYGLFLDAQEKKKPEEAKKKRSWLATLLPFLRPKELLPHERLRQGTEPSWKAVMEPVLAHVPDRSGGGGRGAPSRTRKRPLAEIVRDAEEDHLALAAKFFRASGLEETGFPVRTLGEKGDPHLVEAKPRRAVGPRAGAEPPAPVPPAARGAVLSALTGGLLYRFAYDHDKKLNWEDTQKIFRANGLYRIYVIPPEQTFFEQRLLLIRLEEDGAIVRAAEIRKTRDRYAVRGGYVIPASGVNTLILSSDFSTEAVASMIEEFLPAEARDQILPADGEPNFSGASFLQEHQMGFYTLLNRGEGELRGSVLEGATPGAAVGYRIERSEIGALDDQKLGFLTLDEVEGRRDQILIAAVGRNPAVSIELG